MDDELGMKIFPGVALLQERIHPRKRRRHGGLLKRRLLHSAILFDRAFGLYLAAMFSRSSTRHGLRRWPLVAKEMLRWPTREKLRRGQTTCSPSSCVMRAKRSVRARVMGPGAPLPMVRPSTWMTGA